MAKGSERWLVAGVLLGLPLQAQETPASDLKDLLNAKVAAATRVPVGRREAPAIVSILTAEDIRQAQCRDLVDALALVPGLQATQDVPSGSISVRGLYGFEGRVLVLVDGMALTEPYFGSYPIGNDFPIHLIDRIEVLRGPGSVIYGGTAELAVIQILTRRGEEQDGGRLSLRYGRLPTSYGHQDGGFTWGRASGDLEASLLAFGGRARVSDGDDVRWNSRPAFAFDERSGGLSTSTVVLRARSGDTELKGLYQRYTQRFVTGFAAPAGTPPDQLDALAAAHAEISVFTTLAGTLTHHLRLTPELNLDGSLAYLSSSPFEKLRRNDPLLEQITPSLILQGDLPGLELRAGAEWTETRGHILVAPEDTSGIGFRASLGDSAHPSIALHQWAAFADATLIRGPWRFSGGLRRDQHQISGGQTSPRLALTWVTDDFHAKALYADAFRAPLVANNAWTRFGLDPSKPWRRPVTAERTRVFEVELGWAPRPGLFLTTNLFHQTVRNLIEFRYDPVHDDLFSDNGGRLGTWGAELEVKRVGPRWRSSLAISYAAPLLHPDPGNPYVAQIFGTSREAQGGDTYLAIHRPNELMGASPWKVDTQHHLRLSGPWSAQVGVLWLGRKNGTDGFGFTRTEAAQTLVNTGLLASELLPGLDVDFSIHDLFNQRQKLVTPFYDGGYDTTPWKGREISLSLSWRY